MAVNIEKVLSDHAQELLSRPGVNIVIPGRKSIDGKTTGLPCLVVGVTKKKPLSELSHGEVIPKVIGGAPTDIIETPRIIAQDNSFNILKHRPMLGGVSGFVEAEASKVGTIGGLVRDVSGGDTLVALTNNHCAGLLYDPAYVAPEGGRTETAGLTFRQPATPDGGTSADAFGQVVRAIPLRFGTGSGVAPNLVDAAIVSTGIDDAWYSIISRHMGYPSEEIPLQHGPFPFRDPQLFENVAKSGRTSGYTMGKVIATGVAVNVDYGEATAQFTGQVLIESTEGVPFSKAGDSGSLVLTNHQGSVYISALLFAGNDEYTIATPISVVASQLGIAQWDGDVLLHRDNASRTGLYVNKIHYTNAGEGVGFLSHTPSDDAVDSATITATLPKLHGTMFGSGEIVAALPKVTGRMVGTVEVIGTIQTKLPQVAGKLFGDGFVAATLPRMSGAMYGGQEGLGDIRAKLPRITGQMEGTTEVYGTIHARAFVPVGHMDGTNEIAGTIKSYLPTIQGTLYAETAVGGSIVATLPRITGRLFGTSGTGEATISAVLPRISGHMAGSIPASWVVMRHEEGRFR